jgi:tRNA(Ile2) C34 agmatinyltransferase TiaS
MQVTRFGGVRASSEVMSGILNCVCPDCGGSMGGAGKEFKCQGDCQTDWRRLWEQVFSAGFNRQSRRRSH